MTKLNDLSVGRKVIAAFILVLMATIALGTVALLRLATVKSAGDQVYVHGLPKTSALGEVQLNMSRYRIRQTASIIPGFTVNHKSGQAALDEMAAAVERALRHNREQSKTPEEIARADEIDTAWREYTAMNKTLFAINQSGGQSAAVQYLFRGMGNKYQHLVDLCNAAIDGNEESMGGQFAFAQNQFDAARMLIAVFLALALALSAACGLWLVRSVSLPLQSLTSVIAVMAGGRRDVDVPHTARKDEIGKLAGSISTFHDQLVDAERAKEEQTEQIIASIGTGLEHLAKGDLSHRISVDLTGAFAKLKDDFNSAASRLQATMRNILATSDGITTSADEISTAADDLSHRTEQQAASLEETAAALDEITVTVKATATNARNASLSVADAMSAAKDGGHVVETAIGAMGKISESSKKVTDIIAVIDEIAFQTNLLALNAGVEAARAGDAGKGFAVVASEVRALAQRSSEAAKQIKSLIKASGQYVADGVRFVDESGEALKQIVVQVQKISTLIGQMAQAAEQQSAGIEEVNAAVGQMDQVTQQNAAMVEQSTAASRSLADETKRLSELVGFFSVDQTMGSTSPKMQVAVTPIAA